MKKELMSYYGDQLVSSEWPLMIDDSLLTTHDSLLLFHQ